MLSCHERGFLYFRIYSHEPSYALSLLLVNKQRKDLFYFQILLLLTGVSLYRGGVARDWY